MGAVCLLGTIDRSYLDRIPINEPCNLYGLCDAIYLQGVNVDSGQGAALGVASFSFTVLPSATAVYGVPVSLNDMHNSIFKYLCALQDRDAVGQEECSISVTRAALTETDTTSNDAGDDQQQSDTNDDDLTEAATTYLDTALFIVIGKSWSTEVHQ